MDFTGIMDELIKFRNDRNWEQFHTTKNLTISMCIQTSKLLENFQWRNDEQISHIVKKDKDKIIEKIAELIIYLLYLCRNLDIDSDSMEAAIYSRIIKECANINLTE